MQYTIYNSCFKNQFLAPSGVHIVLDRMKSVIHSGKFHNIRNGIFASQPTTYLKKKVNIHADHHMSKTIA
jgi:hypothetical protein